MTTAAWLFLAVAACAALTDWFAIGIANKRLEYMAKPATLLAMVALALTLQPVHGAVRAWFVVALAFSLAGDVFLMLPQASLHRGFVAGLASFLIGHVAYVVGLSLIHQSWWLTLVGLIVVLIAMAGVGPRIVGALRAGRHASLVAPVMGYMAVISLMVIGAWGTAIAVAVVGAMLFYASDAILAWNRFVEPSRWGPMAVHVTYHLGQLGLTLSLLSH